VPGLAAAAWAVIVGFAVVVVVAVVAVVVSILYFHLLPLHCLVLMMMRVYSVCSHRRLRLFSRRSERTVRHSVVGTDHSRLFHVLDYWQGGILLLAE
jgi:hypothetical protein